MQEARLGTLSSVLGQILLMHVGDDAVMDLDRLDEILRDYLLCLYFFHASLDAPELARFRSKMSETHTMM